MNKHILAYVVGSALCLCGLARADVKCTETHTVPIENESGPDFTRPVSVVVEWTNDAGRRPPESYFRALRKQGFVIEIISTEVPNKRPLSIRVVGHLARRFDEQSFKEMKAQLSRSAGRPTTFEWRLSQVLPGQAPLEPRPRDS